MNQQFSVDALRQIDATCDRFEEAWRSGNRPSVEDYLGQADTALRARLLESLQELQRELILRQLESPTACSRTENDVSPALLAPAPLAAPQPVAVPDPALEQTLNWEGARVVFQVVAGPYQGREFAFDEHDTLLVGRSSRAQLRLNADPHFSRHHFRLEVNPPSCFLIDLGSRNGTFVNGERVAERYLVDGDMISGGRTKMKVSIRMLRDATSATAAPLIQTPEKPCPTADCVGKVIADHRPLNQREMVTAEQPTVSVQGYQVHEQIGAGDLGKVYRATHLASGEQCALKVISPAGRSDEKAMQGFLREVAILNQLQHANIVRIREMGSSGTDLFLSTEFLSTISWEQLSARWSVPQRIRVACGLMVQILGALDYAHSRSLVHRDVKPGNVLIHRIDGKLAAKLADFGLAKQYTTAGMSQMTREGDVIGSLPFMSPEQFINSREAKPTCDIYSAGATLYWMLSGQEPILLANRPCKFLAILEDPPMLLQQRCPEIPLALAQLVHRALEKSAEKRFASAAEMRQQLRAFAK